MANGFSSDTGIADIDYLYPARHGFHADDHLADHRMREFGALLERFGLIDRLINPVIDAARTTGRLYLSVFRFRNQA